MDMDLTLGLQLYIGVLALVLGAVFGSFINCMAWRMVHGESVWKGCSHCAVCGHVLRAADLVPVLSYVALKGRCRYCGERISPRYMLTELWNAAVFLVVTFRFGLSVQTLRVLVLVCILLAIALVDLDSYRIPNSLVVSGICWWLVTLPWIAKPIGHSVVLGLAGGLGIGGGLLVLALIVDRITGKESLGGGDIKLFFMTGLYLGPWLGLFHVILACICGLLFGVIRGQKRIPFGPAIAFAMLICLLFGEPFLQWYLGLLGV